MPFVKIVRRSQAKRASPWLFWNLRAASRRLHPCFKSTMSLQWELGGVWLISSSAHSSSLLETSGSATLAATLTTHLNLRRYSSWHIWFWRGRTMRGVKRDGTSGSAASVSHPPLFYLLTVYQESNRAVGVHGCFKCLRKDIKDESRLPSMHCLRGKTLLTAFFSFSFLLSLFKLTCRASRQLNSCWLNRTSEVHWTCFLECRNHNGVDFTISKLIKQFITQLNRLKNKKGRR